MHTKTLKEIISLLEKKEVSCVEVVKSCLDNIEKNKHLNALNYVNAGNAIKQAREIDARRARGEKVGAMAGAPIIIKDNICTEGIPTTCSSKMLENFIPIYNATVIEKLLAEDAIILGKANMDEFAMGSSNLSSYTGPARNPYNSEYVSGGSSGGSCASVSANLAYAALGSDTGGSIRQPASYCGVVGVKPTYGTVSRHGLIALSSSFDQIGPITKNVEDAAFMTQIISGYDERDNISYRGEYPSLEIDQDFTFKGKKIGVPKEFLDMILDQDVKALMREQLAKLSGEGAQIIEMSMKTLKYAIPVYYVLGCAEAASNLARFDGIKYGYRSTEFEDLIDIYFKSRTQGFGKDVKLRILVGNFALSKGNFDAYFKKAQKVQTLIKQELDQAFQKCDLIITPTTPTPAFKINQDQEDAQSRYICDAFTAPVNIAGIAAISVPAGFSSKGLPIGLQIIAPSLGEKLMFDAAYAFERMRQ
ncbi:MAG: Asp-tRNA(Asn)/Glu-tRNA(Gln) amidotransferase subunit GatA [Clostridiales bacterium]|jgi:aspartyl-tRNA(Asn)/glutamyl-tRNA(Gln) amidotransferase subunit A|nr:Asp-tRNA(Asn)/Glu-tRNA(Gln) amidotransferase subunit GatA [Clostridiales bacterium]